MNYSGEYLVKLARRVIETYLKNGIRIQIPKDAPQDLFDESGAFVTLHTTIGGGTANLRGCIGRIESRNSTLIQSTIDSAIDAAIHDPRFPPVNETEMQQITVEVTVLTPPQRLIISNPEEYFHQIEIGKHGLIAQRGFNRGLLLPQVPVEQKWNIKTYLDYVCMKAGLPAEAWRHLETKISRFEGIIFTETIPNGPIQHRIVQ
ncbi:MAG: TIGR00296 family protein [Candidatus Heimdallarchaeota archaeon]